METVLILAVAGAVNLLCFVTGVRTAQKVNKGEEVSVPIANPLDAFDALAEREEKRRAKKEAKAEQDRLDTVLENIDNYDGTGNGQKDVPGR